MSQTTPRLLAAALTATLISPLALAQDVTLETEGDKVSYGLGLMIGERVLGGYGDIDYDKLLAGIKAQKAGDMSLMSMEDAQAVLQERQAVAAEAASAEAQEAGKAFLAENAARDGVTVTDSGLQYEVITEGEGAKPTVDDTVSVDYVGTLLDGTEFDSSIARGEPATFPLKGVIPGWTEGVQLMNAGSKYRFVIPADLAYGDRGAGAQIGPGETLIFEVKLLEIQ